MNKFRLTIKVLAIAIFMFAFTSLAQAQAVRTFVSGVGNDADPCSRTAPCRTFAGAIIKTFIGGEISVLDPGGYGAVNITKSITIDGTEGAGYGSILASGTTGVIVNVAAGNVNDPERRVTLRRLSINGTGTSGQIGLRTGIRGVNIIAAKNVFIEDCYIQAFVNEGIRIAVTETGDFVHIKDTRIQNCTTGVSITTTTGFAVMTLDRVRIERMTGNGVVIGTHGHAHIRDSSIVNNVSDGINMGAAITDGTVNVENTFIASNGSAGIRNGGTGSIIDISNTSIMQNATGLASASAAAGGGINSHENNRIAGNTAAGIAPNPVGEQ